jgi:TolB protein
MSVQAVVEVAENSQAAQLYRKGLKYLQSGEWAEAIRALEAAVRYAPGDVAIADRLEEARLKARLETSVRVRTRRWIIPWRALLVRALLVVLIAGAATAAVRVVQRQVAPEIQAAQAVQQLNSSLAEGRRYLEAGDLLRARTAYQRVLTMRPGNEEATKGLQQVEGLETIETLYKAGVSAQGAGQLQTALEQYNTILQQSTGYKDVVVRIREIRQRMDEDTIYSRAEADFKDGRCNTAIDTYRQLQALNAGYKREVVAGRLFDCYLRLAQDIIYARPPAPAKLPQAKDYLTQALALRPRDTEASTEERAIVIYLASQAAAEGRNWDEVIRWLEMLYQQRPDYLSGSYVGQLYDAYIASGDAFAAAARYADAWNQYDRALRLPVPNRVVAEERRARISPMITPTPTPTNTPTATPIPTPTPYIYVPPTPLPSATPVPPLGTFRNQIVFKSEKEGQSGFWAMNPDGSNRRYLGNSADFQKQYDELIRRDMRSPDGRCRVYTLKGKGDTFPQIYTQCEGNQPGEVWTRQLTYLAGITYDPVWAPDGSRIAFVSQDRGSDDLWIINPDGTNLWNYTPNEWEWDKHPSWSPDSRKLVFWSNREGTKQIHVIDADGRNMKKIFATTWDEYDPIWVK